MIWKVETTEETVRHETVVERKCDICKRMIEPIEIVNWGGKQGKLYNYFTIHTWHNDWGNDSVDSHEYLDACRPECVMQYVAEYIGESYKHEVNTHEIEISHVRTMEDGAD